MFKQLRTIYNYAFNNRVINYVKNNKVVNYIGSSKAGRVTKELVWDANVAAFGFVKGAQDASRHVRMLQMFSNKKLSLCEKVKYGTRFFIKGREMNSIYKDPAKVGAIIGRFVPMVGTTQAGYLLGKGLDKGAKAARDIFNKA